MKLDPKAKKIKSLLSGSNSFSIPDFQRDFSWEQRNFSDFLNDLIENLDAKLDTNSKKVVSKSEESSYFFGTFLAIGEEDSEKQVIVDGQQRLTTMTIFLAAIDRNILELDKEYNTNLRQHLIEKYSDDTGKILDRPRLLNEKLEPLLPIALLEVDQKFKDSQLGRPENESQEWLLNTFEWFRNELKIPKLVSRITKSEDTEYEMTNEEIIALLRKLSNQLLNSTIIMIYADNAETSNVLYRNFNSRGLPLRESDLIKNELFAKIKGYVNPAPKFWKKMEENIMASGTDLDTFLYHYMKSEYSTVAKFNGRSKQIGKGNTFDAFIEKIPQTEDSYSKFLEKLVKVSSYYRIMSDPNINDKLFEIKNYFNEDANINSLNYLRTLSDLKTSQVKILLIGLFNFREKNKEFNTIFRQTIQLVSMHQTLHVLSKSPANKLLPIYQKYGKKFNMCSTKKEGKDALINLKKELNEKIPDILMSYPMIDKLNYDHSIKTKSLSENNRKNMSLIKSILHNLAIQKQIELDRNTANKAFKPIYDATIEHIVNQSDDNIENRLNIGNLLLIEQSKHGNFIEVIDKKEMYQKSDIEYTKLFDLEKFYDSEKSNMQKNITERSKKIAKDFHKMVLNLKVM